MDQRWQSRCQQSVGLCSPRALLVTATPFPAILSSCVRTELASISQRPFSLSVCAGRIRGPLRFPQCLWLGQMAARQAVCSAPVQVDRGRSQLAGRRAQPFILPRPVSFGTDFPGRDRRPGVKGRPSCHWYRPPWGSVLLAAFLPAKSTEPPLRVGGLWAVQRAHMLWNHHSLSDIKLLFPYYR